MQVYLPTDVVDAIYSKIQGSEQDQADSQAYGGTVYSFPCDSTSTVVGFSFGGIDGKTFTINPVDFILGKASDGEGRCIGGIIGMNFKNGHTGVNMGIIGSMCYY